MTGCGPFLDNRGQVFPLLARLPVYFYDFVGQTRGISLPRDQRGLAAILADDVVSYSRLIYATSVAPARVTSRSRSTTSLAWVRSRNFSSCLAAVASRPSRSRTEIISSWWVELVGDLPLTTAVPVHEALAVTAMRMSASLKLYRRK